MDGFAADQVRVVDFPETRVAVLEHRGDPALIGQSISRFVAWRQHAGLRRDTHATFNILYDAPGAGLPEAFRCDLCVATNDEIAPNAAGIRPGVIAGGRCATLRLLGSDAKLGAALAYLMGNWLPRSGETRRAAPLFVQRVIGDPDDDAVTDVFLPLAG